MQNPELILARDNLSDTLVIELRNMIVDGRLSAGERVNEVHLSQRLGVSRTPLREALARLSQEGALTSVPRIGYFVQPLTLTEFEQVYPMRALLDPEALRLAGLPSRERMGRLQEINERMQVERDAGRIIGLDDEWHLELIDDCPNRVLIDLIKQFMSRTHRYEIALMRERENALSAGVGHKAVLTALRRRDLEAACAALRTNLQTGYQPIASWLKSRKP